MRVTSALLVGFGQREQHLDLAAGAGRRLGVGKDHVGPALHGGRVLGTPSGKRQRQARAVAEGAAGFGQWLEPPADLVVGRGIEQDQSPPHGGEILQSLPGTGIAGELVIERGGALGIALRQRRSFAELGQHAVARRSGG